MKTITIDGTDILVIRQRGLGDGFTILRYFVDEGDGTYSSIGEGWSDKAQAAEVYAKPNEDYLRWVIAEARRQTIEPDKRAEQEKRPDPLTGQVTLAASS